MKTGVAILLGLSITILVTVAYLNARKPPQQPVTEPTGATEQPMPVRERRTPIARTAAANLPEKFNWSQVESTDFKTYMQNLRAIGCPEETIRDLIVAEVNKLFAPRFAALAGETQKFQHWSANRSKAGRESLLAQLKALQEERRGVLRELLGIEEDPNLKWANADLDTLVTEGRYSFLPAEKQAQVRAIMEKYEAQMEAARSGRGDLALAGNGDSTRRLREQRQQELAQVLSPEELKELSLRDSNTADSLRGRFGSVDLTEAEYRTLYDLRKGYEDAQGAVPDYADPEKMRHRSEARRQLEDAYKTALGETRWAELQKQQDPTWRGLSQLAQQNNISQSVLEQAWQQQRMTGEQIMNVMNDRAMSQEQRDGLVQQLTGENENSLKALLGEQAYQQYRQNNPEFMFSSGGGDAFTFVTTLPGAAGGTRTLTTSEGPRTRINTRIQAPIPLPRPQ